MATDSEPTVIYQNGTPLIVWVRDADRNLGTISDHRPAYRLLDGSSPVVVPNDVPAGVEEPSAAPNSQGQLELVFTLAQDPGAFTGNQRILSTGRRTCTGPTTCSWDVQILRDSHGRAIHAEHPILTLDAQGHATITFRGLGFGLLPNGTYQTFPEDSIGMATGSGELAQVDVDFISAVHSPRYLTNSGAVNWEPTAVFNPALNQIQALGVQGPLSPSSPLAKSRDSHNVALISGATVGTLAADQAIVFANVPRQPDFVVSNLTSSDRYPQPGEPISVSLQLRNDGASWQRTLTQTLDVLATWDGEPGVGSVAGLAHLTSLNAGESVMVTIALKPTTNLDQPHMLYITANPRQTIAEPNAGNNQQTTQIGGFLAPNDLTASAQPGRVHVFLKWTAPNDPRIAGYHVYRSDDTSGPMPVGSSFITGFVDLNTAIDHTYTYTVTSYASTGVESDPSNGLTVSLQAYRLYLPVIRH